MAWSKGAAHYIFAHKNTVPNLDWQYWRIWQYIACRITCYVTTVQQMLHYALAFCFPLMLLCWKLSESLTTTNIPSLHISRVHLYTCHALSSLNVTKSPVVYDACLPMPHQFEPKTQGVWLWLKTKGAHASLFLCAAGLDKNTGTSEASESRLVT